MNLFQIPANDQSIYFLGQIFGAVGTVLPVQNPSLLLGLMFKVLNTMALTIGALVVVYITIVGLLATAHEGEFLGKKWSGLWVPLRTTLGIAALFPMPSGYSALQIVAMWIIVQGIGAADTLWSMVLKYTAVNQGLANVNTSGMGVTNIQANMQNLFKALVCQASAKANYAPVPVLQTDRVNYKSIVYYCQKNPSASFCKKSQSDMLDIGAKNSYQYSYAIGPDESCGKLIYCNLNQDDTCKGNMSSTSPGCLACIAQRNALQTIVSTLGGVAAKFVEIDNQYLQFYYLNNYIKKYAALGAAVKPPEPPQWMKDYCSSVGLSGQSCVGTDAHFTSFPPIGDEKSDVVNVKSDTLKNLYMEFPLKAYLQGNDFIDSAVAAYLASTTGAVATSMSEQVRTKELTGGWQKDANDRGWILAGSFYYKLAGLNQKNLAAANTAFNMANLKDDNKTPYPAEPMTTKGFERSSEAYRSNMDSIATLTSGMQEKSAQVQSSVSPAIAQGFESASGSLMSSWKTSLTGESTDPSKTKEPNKNPILAISLFGYQLMITAQFLFAFLAVVIFGSSFAGSVNFMAAGYGLTQNPVGEAFKTIFGFFSPFFVLLLTSLFSLGGLLGIYVPLIPYIIFTMGAIGWIMATIEAMVAAPFVALGILGPGGQHEILGRAEPAMMLIFNVFLRPSLMVFGLLAGMLASTPVIRLINFGFFYIASDIISNPGLAESIVFIAAYTMLIVTALNKIFSLIYVIPERVLTWIGGPAVQYGEGEALGAVKHGAEAAGGAVAGGGREAGGAVTAGRQAIRQARYAEAQKKAAPEVSAEDAEKKKQGGGGTPPPPPPETPAGS